MFGGPRRCKFKTFGGCLQETISNTRRIADPNSTRFTKMKRNEEDGDFEQVNNGRTIIERLYDKVTLLWQLSYTEQLERKEGKITTSLKKFVDDMNKSIRTSISDAKKFTKPEYI